MEPVFTTHDAARVLGVHPFTVGRHIDQCLLKAFRTAGGHRRVLASDLRQFLLEHDMPLPPELAADAGKLKLLVVDDEPSVLRDIRRAFKPFADQVELTLTASGVEALLLLGDLRPDAMLIDLKMPDLDGFEVCRRVAAFKSLAGVKLISMTSLHRSDIIGSALTAGALACLGKPIDPREVLAVISKPKGRTKPAGRRAGASAAPRRRSARVPAPATS